METIIASLAEYVVTFIIIFVILFTIVSYFLTDKNLIGTIKGFFLIVAAFVYSPFVYFRNSLILISRFSLKEGTDSTEIKQYLLIRFLTFIHAFLAIAVVAIITSGIITAWEIFLPPKYAREENARLVEQLENLQEEFNKLNIEVTEMENNWANNKSELIKTYKKEQDSIATKAITANATIEQKLSQSPGITFFLPIKRYLDQNENQSSIAKYERIKKEVFNYMSYQDTPQDIKGLINTYVENWFTLMVHRYEQTSLTEEQIRHKIQPAYSSKKETLKNIEHEKEYALNQKKNIEPMLKYSPFPSFLALISTALTVLLFTWFIGLLTELLWLGIDIAGNVSKIRILQQSKKT
ncbi:MAG: hypothetical protein A2V66_13815 [Ignavibacteria bacterium RBG_13_36_8]|nr:MAG: hypothetical protein A2V66_13815 [Ignavibacteria bacterium RBG_13_36_8]